jgi:hypothetical protein
MVAVISAAILLVAPRAGAVAENIYMTYPDAPMQTDLGNSIVATGSWENGDGSNYAVYLHSYKVGGLDDYQGGAEFPTSFGDDYNII